MQLFIQELQSLIREGGWVFWGLLVLAFGIAFSLLSIWRQLRFPEAPQPDGSTWEKLLKNREVDSSSRRAVQAFLGNEADAEEMEHRLFGILERRFPFAFTLIGAAPLLGLLGTVSGMFATFHGLSISATRAPVDVISAGISEALITTQTGLVIGVPSFIICSLLKVRASRLHAAFRKLASASRSGIGEPSDSADVRVSTDRNRNSGEFRYSHA